jgi:hypothetical protein
MPAGNRTDKVIAALALALVIAFALANKLFLHWLNVTPTAVLLAAWVCR